MGFLAVVVLWFAAYWAGMAGIIWFDGKRQRAAAKAAGSVDFIDRSVLPYMLMGLICGPLPLIFYIGTSRKTAAGWIAAVAIGLGWSLLFGFFWALIDAYARTHVR